MKKHNALNIRCLVNESLSQRPSILHLLLFGSKVHKIFYWVVIKVLFFCEKNTKLNMYNKVLDLGQTLQLSATLWNCILVWSLPGVKNPISFKFLTLCSLIWLLDWKQEVLVRCRLNLRVLWAFLDTALQNSFKLLCVNSSPLSLTFFLLSSRLL